MSHCLTLYFDKELTEQEWREVIAKTVHLPHVQRLRANISTCDGDALLVEDLRQLYRQARVDFMRTVPDFETYPDHVKKFVNHLADAIGAISVEGARAVLDDYLRKQS